MARTALGFGGFVGGYQTGVRQRDFALDLGPITVSNSGTMLYWITLSAVLLSVVAVRAFVRIVPISGKAGIRRVVAYYFGFTNAEACAASGICYRPNCADWHGLCGRRRRASCIRARFSSGFPSKEGVALVAER